MTTATLFQIQSFMIVLLMSWGIYLRYQRSVHIKMMLTAIVWDILLILQIELSRGAVAKASEVIKNPMILNIHVSLALSTVILYIAMIISGRKLYKGSLTIRPKHKVLGWLTYTVRILTLITSFWAVN